MSMFRVCLGTDQDHQEVVDRIGGRTAGRGGHAAKTGGREAGIRGREAGTGGRTAGIGGRAGGTGGHAVEVADLTVVIAVKTDGHTADHTTGTIVETKGHIAGKAHPVRIEYHTAEVGNLTVKMEGQIGTGGLRVKRSSL